MSRNERHIKAQNDREYYATLFVKTMLNNSVDHARCKFNELGTNNPQRKAIIVEGFNIALNRVNHIWQRV